MDRHAAYCTAPRALSTPPDFPFYIALCGVTTRNGCQPPENLLSRRIAAGLGCSQSEANLLAVAEAAERYSIQYCADLPDVIKPFVTIGGAAESARRVELAIGAPGRANTSAGAAAGRDPEDAVRRAALEALEHLHLGRLRAGSGELVPVDPAGEPAIAAHVAWLSGQFRRLEIRARAFAPGYVVAAVGCSDLDGGRRSEGSAARLDRAGAVRAAVEEAIFHWRNMVELERAAPDVGGMAPDDRMRLARYRGAVPREAWPVPEEAEVGDRGQADVEGLLAAVAVVSGRRVRGFDFTTPEVGVPVVKIHLG